MGQPTEKRAFAFDVREAVDETRRIEGYAVVFNSETDLAGEFTEVIRRGAFNKTLQEGDPVALWQHDQTQPIGRRSAGNLSLEQDDHGLKFSLDLPDTQLGRDAYTLIKTGIVRGMSFGFSVIKQAWDETRRLRELLEVRLYEVSPVTWPAYEATRVEARAILESCGISPLEDVRESESGENTLEPSEGHSEVVADDAQQRESDATKIMARFLELAERV